MPNSSCNTESILPPAKKLKAEVSVPPKSHVHQIKDERGSHAHKKYSIDDLLDAPSFDKSLISANNSKTDSMATKDHKTYRDAVLHTRPQVIGRKKSTNHQVSIHTYNCLGTLSVIDGEYSC